MSDKIRQMIDEVDIETSDPERYHIEPDLKEHLANKIALAIAKGVGNPNPVYDLLAKAHADGKYPANTPQGRGDNLKDYTNRILAMFAVSSGAAVIKKEGGRTLLNVVSEPREFGAKDIEEEVPHIPKAVEKESVS